MNMLIACIGKSLILFAIFIHFSAYAFDTCGIADKEIVVMAWPDSQGWLMVSEQFDAGQNIAYTKRINQKTGGILERGFFKTRLNPDRNLDRYASSVVDAIIQNTDPNALYIPLPYSLGSDYDNRVFVVRTRNSKGDITETAFLVFQVRDTAVEIQISYADQGAFTRDQAVLFLKTVRVISAEAYHKEQEARRLDEEEKPALDIMSEQELSIEDIDTDDIDVSVGLSEDTTAETDVSSDSETDEETSDDENIAPETIKIEESLLIKKDSRKPVGETKVSVEDESMVIIWPKNEKWTVISESEKTDEKETELPPGLDPSADDLQIRTQKIEIFKAYETRETWTEMGVMDVIGSIAKEKSGGQILAGEFSEYVQTVVSKIRKLDPSAELQMTDELLASAVSSKIYIIRAVIENEEQIQFRLAASGQRGMYELCRIKRGIGVKETNIRKYIKFLKEAQLILGAGGLTGGGDGSDSGTESDGETKNSDSSGDKDTSLDSSGSDLQTGTKTATITGADTDFDTDTDIDTDTDFNTGTDTDTGTGTGTDSNNFNDIDTDTDFNTDTDTGTGTGTGTGTSTGTGIWSRTSTGTGSKTGTGSGTGTNTVTGSGTGAKTATKTRTGTGTETSTDSDTGTGTDNDISEEEAASMQKQNEQEQKDKMNKMFDDQRRKYIRAHLKNVLDTKNDYESVSWKDGASTRRNNRMNAEDQDWGEMKINIDNIEVTRKEYNDSQTHQ